MGAGREHLGRGGWRFEIRCFVVSGAAAVLALSSWSAVQALLGSRLYRDEPSRAIDLAILSLVYFTPLVMAPMLAARLLRAVWPRRRPPGPQATIASYGASAAGLAALYFAVATLAISAPRVFPSGRPAWLDSTIALGAVLGCAFTAREILLRAAGRSLLFYRRWRVALSVGAGVPFTLLIWNLARDRWGGSIRSIPGLALMAGATLAGLAAGFVFVGTVRLLGRALRRRGARAAGLGAVVVVLSGALAGPVATFLGGRSAAAGTSGEGARSARPNVVFVVADTLRSDHLGCYGAARVRTPALDALAARGARFERAYASASWTCPATASILTGLHASSHGLMTYNDRLDDRAVSVASVFRDAGYDTAGIVANPVLTEKFGFGDGFDLWDEDLGPALDRHKGAPIRNALAALRLWSPPDAFPQAAEVTRRGLEWLDRHGGAPFFLYLHFMDPHDPYAPPPPFDTMYGDPTDAKWRMRFGTLSSLMEGRLPAEPGDLDRLQALYDGAISSMDSEIGRFLAGLESRGLGSNTLVVFTADHGEEFNDHGGLGHEHTLYEELVRIPLILAGPGITPARVIAGPVASIDVAPTVLDVAGLRFPEPVDGESLIPAISEGSAFQGGEIFMEESYIGIRSAYHAFRGLRDGPLKLIGSSFHVEGVGPWKWELYDLATDPAERVDVASARTPEVEALRGKLETWMRRPRAREVRQIAPDEELKRRLRALGYIQ